MNIVLIAIAALLLAGLLWLLLQKRSYQVSRELVVARPVGEVFAYVRDFGNWPAWSPWLMHEPDCQLSFNNPDEEGGGYSWDGLYVGAGSMRHQRIKVDSELKMQLTFLRPFKSSAQVSWSFREQDGGCALTWSMVGSLPFYLSPMRSMLARMIGMDYELGLALLLGQLQPEADHPRIEFIGECHLEQQLAIKQTFNGSFAEMGAASEAAFPQLLQQAGNRVAGMALSVYHEVDLKQQSTRCSLAVPVTAAEPGEETVTVAAGKYYKVRLTGSYQFLGLAWHSAMAHLRMHKIKLANKQPSLEVYVTNPEEVAAGAECVTELLIPVAA